MSSVGHLLHTTTTNANTTTTSTATVDERPLDPQKHAIEHQHYSPDAHNVVVGSASSCASFPSSTTSATSEVTTSLERVSPQPSQKPAVVTVTEEQYLCNSSTGNNSTVAEPIHVTSSSHPTTQTTTAVSGESASVYVPTEFAPELRNTDEVYFQMNQMNQFESFPSSVTGSSATDYSSKSNSNILPPQDPTTHQESFFTGQQYMATYNPHMSGGMVGDLLTFPTPAPTRGSSPHGSYVHDVYQMQHSHITDNSTTPPHLSPIYQYHPQHSMHNSLYRINQIKEVEEEREYVYTEVKPKRKYIKRHQTGSVDSLIHESVDGQRKRRTQVKVACIHCKKACKKCDEVRPCTRCVRLGFADSCTDAPRKERKKGFKRGPYNKGRRESIDSQQEAEWAQTEANNNGGSNFETVQMIERHHSMPNIHSADPSSSVIIPSSSDEQNGNFSDHYGIDEQPQSSSTTSGQFLQNYQFSPTSESISFPTQYMSENRQGEDSQYPRYSNSGSSSSGHYYQEDINGYGYNFPQQRQQVDGTGQFVSPMSIFQNGP